MSDPGRVLLVCARDPTGERTGRKVVLETVVNCLELLGHDVDVVALTSATGPATWAGRPLLRIDTPSLPRVAWAAARAALGHGTLNEALFDSPSVRRAVRRVARRVRPQFVVADTVRAIGPARAPGVPVIVHLDDLLSERYANALASPDRGLDILGYYGRSLPPALRSPAAAMAARLLRGEATRMRRREVAVARSSWISATTSPLEAAMLAARAGQAVYTLPMAVDTSAVGWRAHAGSCGSAVFLGSPGYGPNRSALRWWRDHVRPALDAAGARQLTLTVIGGEAGDVAEFADARMVFTGYVADLGAELRAHDVFVAPIVEGGGIKTKVLDAMANGLPVVATSLAMLGIPATPGRDAWVVDEAGGFADAVMAACGVPHRVPGGPTPSQVGAAGRLLVAQEFSTEVLVEQWRRAIGDLDHHLDRPPG